MARRLVAAVVAALGVASAPHAQSPADPPLDSVIQKMAAYVARYGEKASLFVAVEKYSQSVTMDGMAQTKPRLLVAEFAIIKVPGSGWIGFRDVVELDGKKISDRRDRLVSLLTDETADSSQVTRIANESARFNIGPISRNFNVPTAALFFFQPANLSRFTFTRKDTKKIDGVPTWEIAFKENRSPTFIMTRAGKDVPLEGTLWVVPADGTVVQTRLRMRNFADQMTSPIQEAPGSRPPVNPNAPTGGRDARASIPSLSLTRLDSEADIDVTYRRNEELGVWLPLKMEIVYTGPMALTGRPPTLGRATTRATYSDFKQFGTSMKINAPK
jgi:hypothetical protein